MLKPALLPRFLYPALILALLSGSAFTPTVVPSGAPVVLNDALPGPFHAAKPPDSPAAGSPIFLPFVAKSGFTASSAGWPMAGANPGRTSWTAEEVSGPLYPQWYKQFSAYISPKTQVIAAYDTLYISTAAGLYALDAGSGDEKWVYPTELPPGHSPTVSAGVVYVGGFDHKLHAIDALTGAGLWTFAAGGGFDTNPLVADGLVLAGNRDGYFYAVYAAGQNAGKLAWKFPAGSPIDDSAAYQEGVVYFASGDSYAYALGTGSGALLWRSARLPGAGFQSWWPVVYGDWVVFSGSSNYREGTEPGPASLLTSMERDELYPNRWEDPRGTLVGPLGEAPGSWAAGTPTIDMSRPTITANGGTLPVTEYLEREPWRRTYFVLNRATGEEYHSDFDRDGKPEYAPIVWLGTHSGNRYPPVVGSDGVLYQSNGYLSDPYIAGGHISGWQIGTPYISVVSSDWNAVDEPQAYAAGGSHIYWNLCCDREAGAFDISLPNTEFAERYRAGIRPPTDHISEYREWYYFLYDLDQRIPGYDSLYYNGTQSGVFSAFGGRNGVYGYHGLQNPPIPYHGKVYMHRSNAVIAFGPQQVQPAALPRAEIVPVQNAGLQPPGVETLKGLLAAEIQNIIHDGHLRPGYASTGIFDLWSEQTCGDALLDYWHQPADTLYALLRALPYLPPDLQAQTRAYLQSEFSAYPPYLFNHTGWQAGSPRELYDLPPEVEADRLAMGPQYANYGYAGWGLAPHTFYALWKYAQVFGGAQTIYNASKNQLEPVPANAFLAEMPDAHNAFIAGYLGYLELEKLAGYPETAAVRQALNNLLSLRAQTFSKDAPQSWFDDENRHYCRSMNVSRNFMYLVPELADYLRAHAAGKVQAALQEYAYVAPYWFVSKSETAFGEGAINHIYDSYTIFQARAWIQSASYAELYKYLDIPAFPTGDLFYIHKLTTLIEAAGR